MYASVSVIPLFQWLRLFVRQRVGNHTLSVVTPVSMLAFWLSNSFSSYVCVYASVTVINLFSGYAGEYASVSEITLFQRLRLCVR